MLALDAWRQTRCPHCGGDLEVTTDPANEEKFRHRPAVECHRCAGFANSAEAYKDHPRAHLLLHQVPQNPG